MWAKLASLLGGNLLSGAKDIITAVAGDRAAQDEQAHDETMAVYGQFAAEFGHARTWWDSLVDGLNRLPRPLMTFGIIALFVWAVKDPAAFTEAMLALAAVPEMLWWIFLTIVTFWFGGKMLQAPKFKPPSAEDLKRVVDASSAVGYAKEMADNSKPLSNAAILEWNARRKGGN